MIKLIYPKVINNEDKENEKDIDSIIAIFSTLN